MCKSDLRPPLVSLTSFSSRSVLRNSVTPLMSFEFMNKASPYLNRNEDRDGISGATCKELKNACVLFWSFTSLTARSGCPTSLWSTSRPGSDPEGFDPRGWWHQSHPALGPGPKSETGSTALETQRKGWKCWNVAVPSLPGELIGSIYANTLTCSTNIGTITILIKTEIRSKYWLWI